MRTIIFSIISISYYLSNIYISITNKEFGFATLFFLLATFGLVALTWDFQDSKEYEESQEDNQ